MYKIEPKGTECWGTQYFVTHAEAVRYCKYTNINTRRIRSVHQEAMMQSTEQKQAQRILELEEALDVALTYLEDIMGSDFEDSETVRYIQELQREVS